MESHQINEEKEQTSVSLALVASHHQELRGVTPQRNKHNFHSSSTVLLQENIMLK
jgi:hypothetical protein